MTSDRPTAVPCCAAGGPPFDEGDEHLCDLTVTYGPVRYVPAATRCAECGEAKDAACIFGVLRHGATPIAHPCDAKGHHAYAPAATRCSVCTHAPHPPGGCTVLVNDGDDPYCPCGVSPQPEPVALETWEARMTRAAYAYEAKYPRRDHPARRHGFSEGARWAVEAAEGECDVCSEEGPLFRWYAQNGEAMSLCEDCHGKSFAWLWDQVPPTKAGRA